MQMSSTFMARDRDTWRAWLTEHAALEKEVWLIYYRKQAGKPSISYQESLEEALCFGWVDSLIQKINEETYARKFTPRKPDSRWSEVNRRLAVRLMRDGRMTPSGLARMDFPIPETESPRKPAPALVVPEWLETGLKTRPLAWENFQKLPASHRRRYIGWISDAKREDTRQKRLREAINLLEAGLRIGMGPGEVRK